MRAGENRKTRWLLCCACLALYLLLGGQALAVEEVTARLRLAWGSGSDTLQRWTGDVTCTGGQLSELEPLGLEADEAAALRLDSSRIVIAPLVKRSFDGCDVTVRAPVDARVRITLRSDQSPESREIEVGLSEILAGQISEPLDEFGSFFLAHRSPGDKLRVIPPKDSLVFSPGESWTLRLRPDLAKEVRSGAVLLDLKLHAYKDDTILWQASQLVEGGSARELAFDINCPLAENVYRVSIQARLQPGFAGRFVPWQNTKAFASREVEFVVIDPAAKLPELVDQWQMVLSINPANPSWWQRLPSWAQVSRITGKPAGAIGNIKPVVRPIPGGDLLELPPQGDSAEPYWQAFTLPVKESGKPHLIEVEYPTGAEQHLSISVVEPDAAGRVTRPNVDAGIFSLQSEERLDGQTSVHRIVFWPKSDSPQLLLVNRHETLPAQFGKLRLLRHDDQAAVNGSESQTAETNRLIASYLAKPTLAQQFGAAGILDPSSGLSVDGWKTFLDAANRYAQYLKLCGQNGALVTVAADGSTLYPSQLLRPSPKYDTGLQASAAQDPIRKDVLELLMRVFDREGLQLVPTVQFATPLPKLEALKQSSDSNSPGIELINHTGLSWQQHYETADGLGAYYNLLNPNVQQAMVDVVAEIGQRYQHHQAFRGVAIQLSGRGYATLPGLSWGLDDQTMSQFQAETGASVPGSGDQRFIERARSLVGPNLSQWQEWRNGRITRLYSQTAGELQAIRSDLKLLLTTEELFEGERQRQRLRESLTESAQLGEILVEHGLNLAELQQNEQITVLNPYRLGSSSELHRQALDLRQNVAAEQGELVAAGSNNGALVYTLPQQLRLTSFDAKSPFGAERCYLSLASVSLPAEHALRKQIVTELTRGEVQTFVFGGTAQPLGHHDRLRNTFSILGQLPAGGAQVRSMQNQPIFLKVYRQGDTTTVLLANESPWPITATLPIHAEADTRWTALGMPSANIAESLPTSAGEFLAGDHSWELTLEPYDVMAWKFHDGEIRIDDPVVQSPELAITALQNAIVEIESRAKNLEIQRPYNQMHNPSFELMESDQTIFGWQTRSGVQNSIQIHPGTAHSGDNSLLVRCDAESNVAVESHPFPMPKTGQLAVALFLQVQEMGPESKVYVAIQDAREESNYQQYAQIPVEQISTSDWSRFEFPVDDVPLTDRGELRVVIHMVGEGTMLVDDVELSDLRFDNARRGALVKQIYAARTALEDGKIVDCQRLLEDYWARYLREYVPPVVAAPPALAQQPEEIEPTIEQATEAESPGITDRIRGWVPSIWR